MHPKNILAPIDLDGSEAEEIDYAIRLAEHYDADLWLMPITKQLGIVADVRALSVATFTTAGAIDASPALGFGAGSTPASLSYFSYIRLLWQSFRADPEGS